MFVSQAIADMVTEEHLAEGRLYPPLSTIREVSFKIAVKVGDLSPQSALMSYFLNDTPLYSEDTALRDSWSKPLTLVFSHNLHSDLSRPRCG